MRRKAIAVLVLGVLLFSLVLPVTGFAANDYSYIKVLLKSMGSPNAVTFVVKGAYRIAEADTVDLYPGITYTMAAAGDGMQLSYSNGVGPVTVSLPASVTLRQYSNGSWSNFLCVNNPSYGWRNYAGDMRFSRPSGAAYLQMVNTVFFETYLYGVIAYEMSNSWPLEALKVQAVCARTYSLRFMKSNYSNWYHIGDTSSNQVYKGFPLNSDGTPQQRVIDAVNATAGQIVTVDGTPADGVFSASNGGDVRTAHMHWGSTDTYHMFKADPYDIKNSSSPKFAYYFPIINNADAQSGLSTTDRKKVATMLDLIKDKAVQALNDPNGSYKITCTKDNIAINGVKSIELAGLKAGMPADCHEFTQIKVKVNVTVYGGVAPPPTDTQPPLPTDTVPPTDTNPPDATSDPSASDQDDSPDALAGGGSSPYADDLTLDDVVVVLNYYKNDGELQSRFTSYSSYLNTGNLWNLYANQTANGNPSDGKTSDGKLWVVWARGYGHGVGMSQRGAQEMANEGFSYDQILDFYYNFTTNGRVQKGTVAVTQNPPGPIPGMQASVQTGTVLAQGVAVRAAPDAGATAVATLPQGGSVEVLETNGDWLRVLDASAGVVGWVCGRSGDAIYIQTAAITPAPISLKTVTGKVNVTSYLSLRKSASTKASVLLRIPKNATVTIQQVYSSTWLKVKYKNKTGYVDAKYVLVGGSKNNRAGTLTADFNARNGAGATYGVLGILKSGKTVTVTGSKKVGSVTWYKAVCGSVTGYVDGACLKLSPSFATPAEKTIAVKAVTGKVNASSYVNLRKTANSSASALVRIPKNASVTVVQAYSTSWLKVTYKGKTGYVPAKYVTVGGSKAYRAGTVTTSKLTVRSGAGASYSSKGVIKSGNTVIITGTKKAGGKTWYKINCGGTTGYVESKYVRKAG